MAYITIESCIICQDKRFRIGDTIKVTFKVKSRDKPIVSQLIDILVGDIYGKSIYLYVDGEYIIFSLKDIEKIEPGTLKKEE